MAVETRRRWWIGAVVVLVALALAAFVGFQIAVSGLEKKVAAALGPNSEMASLRVGLTGVIVENVRIPAPAGWPADDAFRAKRVRIVPTLRSLLSGDAYQIASITATEPYFSARRTEEGKLEVLPGLRIGSASARKGPPISASIGEITFDEGVLEIFDAAVATPPLKIRIEEIEAEIHDVKVPEPAPRTSFEFDGVVKGKPHDGTAHIAGWIALGTHESSINTRLRNLDLVALAPYLIHENETGIAAGRVDLDLQSDVKDEHMIAPGTLTITGLELAPSETILGSIAEASRSAMLATLKQDGDRITVPFHIVGPVADPEFTLEVPMSQKVAFGIAKTLGLSLEGLVEGVGTIGWKGGEFAGRAVMGLGEILWELIEFVIE